MSNRDIIWHLLTFGLMWLCTVGHYMAGPMSLLIFHFEFHPVNSPPHHHHRHTHVYRLTYAYSHITDLARMNLFEVLGPVWVSWTNVFQMHVCTMKTNFNAWQRTGVLARFFQALTGTYFFYSWSHFIAVQPKATDAIVQTPLSHDTVGGGEVKSPGSANCVSSNTHHRVSLSSLISPFLFCRMCWLKIIPISFIEYF